MTRIEISLVHGFAMIESRKQIRKAAVQYSIPNVSFVRTLLLQHIEMLRDARTAGLVKLHCGKGFTGERQEWADNVKLSPGFAVSLKRERLPKASRKHVSQQRALHLQEMHAAQV